MGHGDDAMQLTFCDPRTRGNECYATLMQNIDDTDPDYDGDAELVVPMGAQWVIDSQLAAIEFIQTGEGGFNVDNQVERMNMLRSMYDIFGANF